MLPILELTAVLVASAGTVLFLRRVLSPRRAPLLPPGPTGVSMDIIASQHSYLYFHEWTKEFGGIMTVHSQANTSILGRLLSLFVRQPSPLIILGRHKTALEIMQKRGDALADRPRYIAASEVLSGNMRLFFMRAGVMTSRMRKELHMELKPTAVETYEPLQLRAARNLVLDIIDDPIHHQDHAKRFAATVMLSFTYGKLTPTSYSDPEVVTGQRLVMRAFAASRPGAWRIEKFPFLRYVSGYLTELRDYHHEELQIFLVQMNRVRAKMGMNAGDVPQSLAKSLLAREAIHGLAEAEMAYLAGGIFNAGSHTTAAAISTIILCAACFPLAQERVQAEIDSVVGRQRAPAFSDRNSLPVLMSFILESFRWRPVVAPGIAHRAMDDIIWGDYCIPKGATVIANHWSICHDPSLYESPQEFNPQRWLDQSGQLLVGAEQKLYYYGFGRRVCPGRHLADRSIFITSVLILWAFSIREISAEPIDIDAFEGLTSVHPLPFKVDVSARFSSFPEIQTLIEEYGN